MDIYEKIDSLIRDLKESGYEAIGNAIYEAKLSGSVGTEILGLVRIELGKYQDTIEEQHQAFIERFQSIEKEIAETINLK